MPKWIANRIGDDNAPNVVLNDGVFSIMDQFWCEINPTIGWNAALVPMPGRFTLTNGTGVETPDSYFTLFSSSGSVAVSPGPSLNVEYVVVGGGGGGGNANFTGSYNYGGGGGAGGFRTGTLPSVAGGATYPVTIGAGGVPVGGQTTPIKPAGTPGNNGAQTTWSSITSEGGGAGGGGAPGVTFAKGENGASGGGSGGYGWPTQPSGNMQAGTTNPVPTQGNDGAPTKGAGGGAAGAGGQFPGPGDGGDGLIAFNSPGTYVPNIPTDFGAPGPATGRWFAAGGGAGAVGYGGAAGGDGGAGGGGTGGVTNAPGGAATVKTGSGGGGAGRDSGPTSPTTKNRGGTAGDGVVLLRWYK